MRARIATSVALAAALTAGLAGCTFITPIATMEQYEPSDGVSASVGDIDVRNAVVISENGILGNLIFHAVNSGTEDVELNLQYTVAGTKKTVTVDLPANASTDVGYGGGEQLLLNGILAKPGTLMAIYFQYGDQPGEQVLVPVLDGSLPEYTELLPTLPPSPIATIPPVATPAPTETSAP